MSARPYTGPGLYLTGGRFENHAGNLFARPTTECLGGQCSKPTPAPALAPAKTATVTSTTPDNDFDPAKLYAARERASQEANRNRRPEPVTETNLFTAAASAAIYGARHV